MITSPFYPFLTFPNRKTGKFPRKNQAPPPTKSSHGGEGSPLHPRSTHRSDVDPMLIWCRSVVDPLSIRCRSVVDTMSIRCRYDVDPTSIRCWSDVDPLSIRCRSDVEPLLIRCRYDVEPVAPMSVRFRSIQPIRCWYDVDPMSITSIQCRSNGYPMSSVGKQVEWWKTGP